MGSKSLFYALLIQSLFLVLLCEDSDSLQETVESPNDFKSHDESSIHDESHGIDSEPSTHLKPHLIESNIFEDTLDLIYRFFYDHGVMIYTYYLNEFIYFSSLFLECMISFYIIRWIKQTVNPLKNKIQSLEEELASLKSMKDDIKILKEEISSLKSQIKK